MREYITSGLLVALSLAFLTHFYFIVAHGTLIIQEPNLIILSVEIAALFGCAIFGVVNMVRAVRRRNDGAR